MKTEFTFIDSRGVPTEIPIQKFEYLLDRESDTTQVVGEGVALSVLGGFQLLYVFLAIAIVLGLIVHVPHHHARVRP